MKIAALRIHLLGSGTVRSLTFYLLLLALVAAIISTIAAVLAMPQMTQSKSDRAMRYVDIVSGDDGYDGLTEATAWKTIQHAANRLRPGETCLVLSGRYHERVKIRKSGTVGSPITFQAEGAVITQGFTVEGDYIHVKGFEISATKDHWKDGAGIFIEGKGCTAADNFIHNVTRVGIHVFAEDPDSPEVSECSLLGNRIVRAGLAGIEVLGRNHLVEGNEISQTLQYPRQWKNPPEWADADGIHFFGSGHVIRKNYVHSIRLEDPENIDPHIDAIQTFGPAYQIVIEENIFTIPDPGMQIAMIEQIREPVRDIVFRNNVFVNTFRGLNIWNRGDQPLSEIAVLNNTFVGIENYAMEFHGCSQVIVANNLFFNVGSHIHPYAVFDRTGDSQVDHNLHFMSDGRPPAGEAASDDLWQIDPRLMNAGKSDFRPSSSSPLIDAGRELDDVKTDADGTRRPFGKATDIGAYEFISVPAN